MESKFALSASYLDSRTAQNIINCYGSLNINIHDGV